MRILKILLILVSFSILNGCMKEVDPPETQYVNIGDVISIEGGLWVSLGNGTVLYDPDFDFNDEVEVSVGERWMLIFEIVETNETEANEYTHLVKFSQMLFVPVDNIVVIDETSRDTMQQEPVAVNRINISDHYINVEFTYYGNGGEHYFALAYDTARQEEGVITFDLMHITDDEHKIDYYSVLSFDLDSFNWEGEEPYKFVFRYKEYDYLYNSIDFEYSPPTN